MAYFLGIDAGGTKTQYLLADESRTVARVQGGSIKITRVSPEEAQRNLVEMLDALTSQSGIPLQNVMRTCVGLSGSPISRVVAWVRHALTARVGGDILLRGDEEIALDAAFPNASGILVIAGTGSNVVGRTTSGHLVRAGGWGPVLSDQGSGSWIGLQGLRAIFYAMDCGEETSLLPALHQLWGTTTLEELIDLGNQVPGRDLSLLAPMVAECGELGDGVARRVLIRTGEELADLVLLAMRKGQLIDTKLSATDVIPWTVAYTGSAIANISIMLESMMAAISKARPDTKFMTPAVDAVMGALWHAQQNV